MKILVTGCAGYLGTVLCKELLAEGNSVIGLDNLLYGVKPLASLRRNKHFRFVKGDVRDITTLVRIIQNVDAVVHLASIVGAEATKLSAKNAVVINSLATRNIAELCTIYNVKHLVFTSTASVYGKLKDGFATERTELRPIELYGETKVKSERGIREAFDDFTILRLGTLFGLSDRMRFDLVVNLFTAKACAGEALTLFGGQQERPLLHVADAARAISFVLSKNVYGTYNLAQGNYRIIDIAEKVQRLIPCTITGSDDGVVDERNYRISCDKIQKTGFKTKHAVEYGISEIIQAFDKGIIKDYRAPVYSNHAKLFTDKKAQAKVYTQGAIPKW